MPLEKAGHGRWMIVRRHRIVGEIATVEDVVDHIQAEAVDAAIQPEPGHIQDRFLDVRIPEIEIGLFRQEVVQIVLPTPRTPTPRRAPERGLPVIGRRSVGLGLGPDVPVGLGSLAGGGAFLEPGMLVGGVRPHLIDDDLQVQRVGLLNDGVEVGQGPEQGIDHRAIVGDVVATNPSSAR